MAEYIIQYEHQNISPRLEDASSADSASLISEAEARVNGRDVDYARVFEVDAQGNYVDMVREVIRLEDGSVFER